MNGALAPDALTRRSVILSAAKARPERSRRGPIHFCLSSRRTNLSPWKSGPSGPR